ncbi:UNVERIFIED_CONTAM: hypothetical protein Sangu_2266300 [Sesamum angustifolium]|uniref:F-box associated domain-containing protein n=1 Tax=Sesamum angustifolium TaxID=2727405 RepID=A0AAW2L4X2_9LAMI
MFQPFPPPFPGRKLLGSLAVLGDCLCLCDNSSEFDIDIWVMKEYGVEKSWAKEIVIRKIPELAGPSFEVVQALKIFTDVPFCFSGVISLCSITAPKLELLKKLTWSNPVGLIALRQYTMSQVSSL